MCEVEKSCEDGDVCLNGGTCTNSTDKLHNVTCDCPSGYRYGQVFVCYCFITIFSGDFCEYKNQCHDDTNPCGTGTCLIDAENSYLCHCTDGSFDEKCPDPTPCDDDPCLNGGTCHLKGVFAECSCPLGFHGTQCENMSVCHPEINICGTGNCTVSNWGIYQVLVLINCLF